MCPYFLRYIYENTYYCLVCLYVSQSELKKRLQIIMVAAAVSARDKRRRSRAPEGGATPAIGNDDGEEHHQGRP